MTTIGYWLEIEGFPHLLGTKDLPGLVPTAFVPSDDAPTGVNAFPGRLVWPTGGFDEQIEPVTGAPRASGITFRAVDDPTDPVLDKQLTIDPRRLTSATVASSISATDTEITLNATVPSSITGLSYPAVVWINDEAILVDSYAANTLSNCTRGYYGTKASAHVVDAEIGQYPVVWGSFPWSSGRRVILWAVDDSSLTTATAVWRGYMRAPVLNQETGASYNLPCESIATWEMQRPAGGLTYTTRLRGYSSEAFRLRWHQPNWYSATENGLAICTYMEWSDRNSPVVRGDLDSFLQWSRDELSKRLRGTNINGSTAAKTANTNVAVRFERVGSSVYFEVQAGTTGGGDCAVSTFICGEEQHATARDKGASIYRGSLWVTVPPCALTGYASVAKPLPVTRLDGLPATFDGATTYSDGAFTTRIRPVLTALYDESTRLLILPESSTADDSNVGGGPSITGTARYVPARSGAKGSLTGKSRNVLLSRGVNVDGYAVRVDTGDIRAWIDRPLRLAYAQWIICDHWAYGLKRALEDTNVSTGSDARNWDWTEINQVARLTSGGLSSREWYFDGTKTIKDVLGDTLTLDGCGIATGLYGRLRIIPVKSFLRHWSATDYTQIDCIPPSAGSTRVVAIDSQWSVLTEAVTNVVSLSVDNLEVSTRDVRSFGTYGRRAALELKIEGLPLDQREGEDPYAISQRLLQRITGIWSEPVGCVTVTIPAQTREGVSLWYGSGAIYIGDFIMLRNAWKIPDGEGARGLDLRGLFVAGRRVDLGRNTIELTLWVLRESYGYAPAIKVASVNAAAGTVTAATGYVRKGHMDATDYAGGLLGTGGVSGFAAGDKVRLIVRDSTSPSQETYEIQSINSVSGVITMTTAIATAPFNWPALASTGWVDLIPATYTTCQASQKQHQFIGNGTAAEGVIGASSDQSREFAA